MVYYDNKKVVIKYVSHEHDIKANRMLIYHRVITDKGDFFNEMKDMNSQKTHLLREH